MTPEEYQALFSMSLSIADHGSLRSAQSDGGLLGASDAGGCPHKAVLTVRQTPATDVVKKGKAMVGTALHKVWLPQLQALNPDLIVETELTVTLPSGAQILVHPDVIDPVEGSVTDLKTVGDLAYTQRIGISEQHQMQRALYYLAAHQAGLVPADGIVRNLYVAMDDADQTWVQQEPFSMDWVERADLWFADVQYAIEHNEEGRRDAPIYYCQSYCPFYSRCKPPLEDASGELHNLALREAVLTAFEAVEQRKHWALVEKQAKELLKGVSGRVGNVQTVATWVNSGSGYFKSDFRLLEGESA